MKKLFSDELISYCFDALDPILIALTEGDREYAQKYERKNELYHSLDNRTQEQPSFNANEMLTRINEYFDLEMSLSTTEQTAFYLSGLIDSVVLLTKLNRINSL